ncbi:YceD family protein [Pseudohongiella sp.]|uniref:Large ribosomal RNA subunit accumulation protein YceD n=1 Tax=marine sediment metagenome TaxID=412755 RepID=A0A0F9YE73_9ZZZZ|nr:DUF177 domain-containing protein [Pseudohongiella sp.]HDZ09744.1 DUF177 domain-containing protein [Pseudohongiella sp.]HEA61642.1 DUF177 domain-containing protein [Pseudohongiella sp.]
MDQTLEFASPLLPFVDARKAFRHEQTVEGYVPLQALKNLSAMLTDSEGRAHAVLMFRFDQDRRRRIDGELQATVNVQCQRCLEPVQITLSERFELAVVSTEAMAKDLPASLDPWLSDEETLNPADIVEEQLILCMPIVSTHQQCNAAIMQEVLEKGVGIEHNDQAEEKQASSPFSVLATLKNKPESH